MRALFLSPTVPYPPLNGGHHRTLGCARCLSRMGPTVMFAVGDPVDSRAIEARRALAARDIDLQVFAPTGPAAGATRASRAEPEAVAHFRCPDMRRALERLRAEASFDLVHVEEAVMAQYADVLPYPRVIDRQKVEWTFHEAMAEVEPRRSAWHRTEAARYREWERSLVGRFDRILVAGAGDGLSLGTLHDPRSITEIPIAIPDELVAPSPRPRGVSFVLLYGARDYGPNAVAEAWFLNEAWPSLSASAPHLRLVIVGSGVPPPDTIHAGRQGRVEVRGFVADVAPILGDRGALVVPLRVGGGARTKVLEAMACGMPVVSTALGVENLGLVADQDYLRAETAQEMVAAVLALARDPERAALIGASGCQRAQSHRWSQVERRLEAVYLEVAGLGSRARFRLGEHGAVASRRGEDAGPGPTRNEPGISGRMRDAVLRSRWGPGVRRRLDAVLTRSDPNAGRLRRMAARVIWRLVRH